MKSVMDFGASGNGKDKDTASVQKAIDAGGIVFFPPGTYLCGTLYLRDFTTLDLAPGAVLLASPDKEDYNKDDFAPDNCVFRGEAVSGAHFLIANGCSNVTIRGGGRIDGNRQAFYELPSNIVCSYETITWRPGQMLFLRNCRNLSIMDVELSNSPYWSCFIYNCEKVIVRGLRITNPMATPNGDGLDIDSSRKVTVSDCIIETGDDCIAIRSSDTHGCKAPVCENIVIENCILTTVCNAVRIGVGTGVIRKLLMNNISITESRTGFCFAVRYSKGCVQIEDSVFSNLQIDAKRPFSFHSNAWGRKSGAVSRRIENLSFSNIRGTVSAGCIIDAFAPGDIRRINFDRVAFKWTGKAPETVWQENSSDFTEATTRAPKAVWFIRNGEEINFRDCSALDASDDSSMPEEFVRLS